jgi:hypothetical protein
MHGNVNLPRIDSRRLVGRRSYDALRLTPGERLLRRRRPRLPAGASRHERESERTHGDPKYKPARVTRQGIHYRSTRVRSCNS